MVNNATSISKTNNHLSSQIIVHEKKPRDMKLEIQYLAWDRHTIVAGLNELMRFPIPVFPW